MDLIDSEKIKIARQKGVISFNLSDEIDQVKFIHSQTNGIGADGVIITASNKSDNIISNSAQMSGRGRVILVGVVGLNINRSDFYEKEIKFQVSCSYGAGRYDEEYEIKGNDYPVAYVRWTEKRILMLF